LDSTPDASRAEDPIIESPLLVEGELGPVGVDPRRVPRPPTRDKVGATVVEGDRADPGLPDARKSPDPFPAFA